MRTMRITGIEIIPIRLPLTEPFVISYGTFWLIGATLCHLKENGYSLLTQIFEQHIPAVAEQACRGSHRPHCCHMSTRCPH